MSWLAITTPDARWFSLHGLGEDKQDTPILPDRPDALLTRGTLMFETQPLNDGNPVKLLEFTARDPYPRALSFQTTPAGGIQMTQTHGAQTTTTQINRTDTVRRDVLRVSYAWDAPARWGRLTLEQPEDPYVEIVTVHAPVPLSLADLRLLMLGGARQYFGPAMIFAAVSNRIEPVGPTPSLMPQTPIATPWGYKAAGALQRGDTVTTRDNGVVPVVHRVTRCVPAFGSFQPLRLRAPYFGLEHDILVSPEQRVLIDGPEVEYLFGQEAVLVPARHLVNGYHAKPADTPPCVRYAQVLLPRHETLLAAGGAIESLYIGRLRRNSAVLENSVLQQTQRAGLPDHGQPSHQILRQFEAVDLARRRAA